MAGEPATTSRSSPPAPVEAPVLQRLRAVLGGDGLGAGEVGDRPRDTDDAVVAACGEPQACHRGGEQSLRVGRDRTQPAQAPRGHLRVRTRAGARAAPSLTLARARHPPPDGRRVVAGGRAGVLLALQRRQLHVQVDAVEQRTRQPSQVSVALGGCAQAPIERRTAAATGVGRGDELEARGEIRDAAGARDGDAAVLERLAQRLEHVLLELRQLVQEQHPAVGERHLARPRRAAAADQAGDRDGVMRRAERARVDERAAAPQESGHRPDRRHLEDLVARERRQHRGEAPCEHRLAGPGRSNQQHVVAAGRGDLQRALGVRLAAHVSEIGVVDDAFDLRGRRGHRGRLTVEQRHRVAQRARGQHTHAVHGMRLGRIVEREEQRRDTAAGARARACRDCSGHAPRRQCPGSNTASALPAVGHRWRAGPSSPPRTISDRVLGRMSADDVLRPVALVVDDEESVRESFRLVLDQDYEVLDAPDGARALELVRANHVDVVLLDIRLPEMDGIEVLERLKALDDSLEVILVTAVKTVRTAVAAMKLGAFDYVTKPFEDEELLALMRRAVEKRSLEREVTFLRGELARRHDRDAIIGEHPEMQKLARLVTQLARTHTTLLITGESGTGKELIARAIHHRGPRRDKPFVPVNPAAIPDALVESEPFGHEKGGFTGANQRTLRRFDAAQGGPLFLGGIGLLPVEWETKLLRELQEREIERVGGTRAIKIDVRIVAATNTDLKRTVAAGTFREDLYYRLNVVPIAVPPLRARIEDLPRLVDHFVRRYNHELNKHIQGFTPEALTLLASYAWPGNVRELQNIVERTMVLVEGLFIGPADLPLDLTVAPGRSGPGQAPESLRMDLNQASDRFERIIVQRVLEEVGGNVSEAARVDRK